MAAETVPYPKDSRNASTVDIDDLELEAVGYRRQMPRQFSVFSLMSLSFALTCTWSGTGASMGVALTDGSSAATIWSLLIGAAMTFLISLGMAELASAYPVAGAQYYWSFMVSSEKYKPFAAYVSGWITLIGWWLGAGSVCNFVSSMILAIATLWYPDYSPQHWQQWLLYCGILWLAFSINIFGSRLLPLINKCILIVAVASLSATSIALLVCARDRYPSAAWIFGDTTNSTGWSSDGFAFVLAVSNAVYAYLGTDCGAHMCEEIPNPGRNVPKVILYPVAMGLATTFPFTVACMAAISDLNGVLNTPTGLPLMAIYYQGTGSRVGATILMALFALCFFGCAIGNGTTSSRTMWAISRDGAMPFSHIWMQVSPRFEMPMNAILLSGTVVSLYGLIFLGSSTAFSAMINACIIFLQTSCVIPQGILLWRGRDKVLPKRYFSLGRWGVFVNAGAVAWVVFMDIVYCFPTLMPVTKENMSYVSVVAVGFLTFIIVLWFVSKRGKFKGPKVNLQELHRRREMALYGDSGRARDVEGSGSDPEVAFGKTQATGRVSEKAVMDN